MLEKMSSSENSVQHWSCLGGVSLEISLLSVFGINVENSNL